MKPRELNDRNSLIKVIVLRIALLIFHCKRVHGIQCMALEWHSQSDCFHNFNCLRTYPTNCVNYFFAQMKTLLGSLLPLYDHLKSMGLTACLQTFE